MRPPRLRDRLALAARPRRLGPFVAPLALAACAASAPSSRALSHSPAGAEWRAREVADSVVPAAWRAVACASCARARVEIAIRSSVAADGGEGVHTFARVRNLNPHAVALVAEFIPDYTAHGDGNVPSEQWPLRLAPADSAGAEAVVMLRTSRPQRAAVRDAERY